MAEGESVVARIIYNVNLARVYWGRRTNRADRAVKLLREFVRRHTKADRVLITNEVNNFIWRRGREKPPRRIKVYVKVVEHEEEGEEEEGRKVREARVYLAKPTAKPGRLPLEAKS